MHGQALLFPIDVASQALHLSVWHLQAPQPLCPAPYTVPLQRIIPTTDLHLRDLHGVGQLFALLMLSQKLEASIGYSGWQFCLSLGLYTAAAPRGTVLSLNKGSGRAAKIGGVLELAPSALQKPEKQ